jgi:hypothetical protein
MIVLTLEEIKQHGISGNELSEIVFQNKTFTKGSTYSQRCRESAIAYGQQYSATQGECVVIDNGTYLTLWLEQKSLDSTNKIELIVSQSLPISTPETARPAINDSQPKTVNINNNDRPLKKYRGHYY